MLKRILIYTVFLVAMLLPVTTFAAVDPGYGGNFVSVHQIPTGSEVCPFCGAGAEEGSENSGQALSDSKKAGLVLFFEARQEIMEWYREELAKIEAGAGTEEKPAAKKKGLTRRLLTSFVEKKLFKAFSVEKDLATEEKIKMLKEERQKRIAEARQKYLEQPLANLLEGDGVEFKGPATEGFIVAIKRLMLLKEFLKTGKLPYRCACGLALTQEQIDNIVNPDKIPIPEDIDMENKPLVGGISSGDSTQLDSIYEQNEINQTGSQIEESTGGSAGSSVFGETADNITETGAGTVDNSTPPPTDIAPPAEIAEFTESVGAKCYFISQKQGWRCNSHHRGCGWTSLAMVLKTLGANVDPDVLFAQTEMVNSTVAQSGIGYQEVQRLARKYLPSATFSTNGSINDLMEMINLGRPAIVTTTEYGGHFMVVVGYGNKDGQPHIIAHDPESTAYRAYTLENFKKIWDKIYMNFAETSADPNGPALPPDTQTVVANSQGSSNNNMGGSSDNPEPSQTPSSNNQPEVGKDSVVLDVPKLNQIKNAPPLASNVAYMSCGPTSTLMILQYFGINPGIEAVANKAKCDSGGSYFTNNISAATSYGLKSESVTVGYGAFQKALEANKPIFVRTLDWNGHFVVVTGIRNGKVIVNDPYPQNYGVHSYNNLDGNLYREYDADEFFSSGFVTNACAIYN